MANPVRKNPHAVALGQRGGRATSEAKAKAVRRNGRLGGRPRRDGKPPERTLRDAGQALAHALIRLVDVEAGGGDLKAARATVRRLRRALYRRML